MQQLQQQQIASINKIQTSLCLACVVAGYQMVCNIWSQLEDPGAVSELDLVSQNVDGTSHMMIPALHLSGVKLREAVLS